MQGLTHHDITLLLLAIAVLLGAARILGELAMRLGQPAVIGEILSGILLGPTVLGRINPAYTDALFPSQGPVAVALQGLTTLAIVLFLLVAGLEIDLSTVWRQGRRAAIVSVTGIVGPFAVGLAAAWLAPRMMGAHTGADPVIFALFVATALSISALPVIAKTLMDLNLFRTDIGMTIVAAAVFNDLVGWIIFAVILAMMGGNESGPGIATTIWLTLAFTAASLTIGRWLIHKSLPWIQGHTSWPGGVLGFVLVLGLGAASFTEWLGVHAIFGAFMLGVALGDSSHLRKRTRTTLEQFIGFIFAPLFFASLGLHIDFLAHFDPLLCAVIFVIATVGKIGGCLIGARIAKIPRREGWAIAFGMNARGAMEIILGLLALRAGLIGEPLFVALVIMALGTSIISGPLMQWVLRPRKSVKFLDYLGTAGFAGHLNATHRRQAIEELCARVATPAGIDAARLVDAVWHREQLMATGLANRVAVPNARIPGLAHPIVAMGLSSRGIDFDAADGQTSQIICLLLVPEGDDGGQWEILSNITSTLAHARMRERLLAVSGYTELRALLRIAQEGRGHDPSDERPRHGYIFVGASPLARSWARRLIDLGTPVWLVDSNRGHIEAAQREGQNAVAGNATSEATLMVAHAFEARGIVALTPNSDINLEIIAFARTTFGITDRAVVLAPERALPTDERIGRLAIERDWVRADRSMLSDEALKRWARVLIDAPGPLTRALVPDGIASGGFVPLIVEHATTAPAAPATLGMALVSGDTVHGLIIDHSNEVDPTRERIRRLFERSPILDIEEGIDAEDLFRQASEALSVRLHIGVDELRGRFAEHQRMQEGSLTPDLAVPHLRLDGAGIFEMVICRAAKGVFFAATGERPTALFVLVSSLDNRRQHLEMLAVIAHAAQRPDFFDRWQQPGDVEALRAWLIETLIDEPDPS